MGNSNSLNILNNHTFRFLVLTFIHHRLPFEIFTVDGYVAHPDKPEIATRN